jgi:hypothetical protein
VAVHSHATAAVPVLVFAVVVVAVVVVVVVVVVAVPVVTAAGKWLFCRLLCVAISQLLRKPSALLTLLNQ